MESNNGQIIDLVEKIDSLKNENKCLRDQNDELVIELEATKRYFIIIYCILIKPFLKVLLIVFVSNFRTDNLNLDRSFDSNVRNFLAEENSPNCFGKVKQFMPESSAEDGGSIGTSETYTIEYDLDAWKKVYNKFK